MFRVIPAGAPDRVIELVCAGASLKQASAVAGVSYRTGRRAWRQRGHMELVLTRKPGGLPAPDPVVVSGGRGTGGVGVGRRWLTDGDRAMIAVGHQLGMSCAAIAVMLGRDRSVIWRELHRNASPDGSYRSEVAARVAARRRRRPKRFKLASNPGLCRRIEDWMDQGWSPGLIAEMLAVECRSDKTRTVSHETIYRALYVQTRGGLRAGLRADLHRQLSLQRSARVPRGTRNSSPYREAFRISQRPPEVADRSVPGHWEGDLIMGAGNRSAIGTLVERSTRFVILLHLPGGRHDAATVAEAMVREMGRLPEHLRRSITWDRGTELADYADIQLELNAPIYFCDPHSPWQRGSNENTNRLLRFWFAKGSDLSVHTPGDLRRIAATLNRRPRPTLKLATPAQRLNELLTQAA